MRPISHFFCKRVICYGLVNALVQRSLFETLSLEHRVNCAPRHDGGGVGSMQGVIRLLKKCPSCIGQFSGCPTHAWIDFRHRRIVCIHIVDSGGKQKLVARVAAKCSPDMPCKTSHSLNELLMPSGL